LKENQGVQAKVIIANASARQICAVTVVLAGLLSGFFWMGYWTAEVKSVFGKTPNPVVIERNHITAPANRAPIDPFQELGIKPEDSVRL
jgi:hypothetical protein